MLTRGLGDMRTHGHMDTHSWKWTRTPRLKEKAQFLEPVATVYRPHLTSWYKTPRNMLHEVPKPVELTIVYESKILHETMAGNKASYDHCSEIVK